MDDKTTRINDRINDADAALQYILDELRGGDMPLAETLAFNQILDLWNKLDELRTFVRRWLPRSNCTHHEDVTQPVFVPILFEDTAQRESERLASWHVIKHMHGSVCCIVLYLLIALFAFGILAGASWHSKGGADGYAAIINKLGASVVSVPE